MSDDSLRQQGNQALGASRDSILDLIFRHEHERHGGGYCLEERVNAVAFIAHSLGLAADDNDAWELAREIIKHIYEHGHDLH